jgi:uncharacterized protein
LTFDLVNYQAPLWLRNGYAMTIYAALRAGSEWRSTVAAPEPDYQSQVLLGAQGVPLFTWLAKPDRPKGTIVATYGITGSLEDQWFLRILGTKAYALGYAVLLFDWRAHGRSAQLSSTLTSDGLNEGPDYLALAAAAKALGCVGPFWFCGYSLGGQLALWAAQSPSPGASGASNPGASNPRASNPRAPDVFIDPSEIGGIAVICPNLDSNRSLRYLSAHPIGCHLERRIAMTLRELARELDRLHPGEFDREAIEASRTIADFDRALVIDRLGFASVADYYAASSPLSFLPTTTVPILMLYAIDDPLFDPVLVPEIQSIAARNPNLDLYLTEQGGHVGYISDRSTQVHWGDADRWWAWNRVLDWMEARG